MFYGLIVPSTWMMSSNSAPKQLESQAASISALAEPIPWEDYHLSSLALPRTTRSWMETSAPRSTAQ